MHKLGTLGEGGRCSVKRSIKKQPQNLGKETKQEVEKKNKKRKKLGGGNSLFNMWF